MNLQNLLPAVLFILLSAAGCKPEYDTQLSEPAFDQPKAVQTIQLVPTTTPLPLSTSGKISQKQTVNLSFKTGGFIESLTLKEGDTFAAGDRLASLDLTEINAQVTKAEQSMQKAKRDFERGRRLFTDSAYTSEQIQDLETAYEVAKADYQIALFNQKHSVITAGTDGTILRRFSEVGEQVEPGQPVYRTGAGHFVVNVSVADRDVVRIAPGDSANVQPDAFYDESFDARVTHIADDADPSTGTFDVELMIDSGGEELKSGMIADVTLYPSNIEPYYRVPMNALVEADSERARLFTVDNHQTARLISLPYQTILADAFTVQSRHVPDDIVEIITGSPLRLRDGDSIQIQPQSSITERTDQ